MLTFVQNDSGRPEAADGAHDDLVMAHAIALHLHTCGQQSTTIQTVQTVQKQIYDQIYEEETYEPYDNLYAD